MSFFQSFMSGHDNMSDTKNSDVFLEKTTCACLHVCKFPEVLTLDFPNQGASIGQAPGQGWKHNHWDPKCMNLSLLAFCQNNINLIGSEAMQVQDHSREVILCLQVKALKTFLTVDQHIHGQDIPPYYIITSQMTKCRWIT